MSVRSLSTTALLCIVLAACGNSTPPQPLETKESLEAKAAQGDASAMFELGALYHDGGPDTPADKEVAFEWFTKAADAGEVRAQFNLGVMYYNGDYVTQNYQKALGWFEKAAEQGNARAQFNLGVMYYRAEGVEEDFDTAHRFFTSAALQGFNEAMFNLGVMHAQGQSVEPDTGVAYAWFAAADKYGNPNARAVMDQIEESATREQKKALTDVSKSLIKQVDAAVENGGQVQE